MTDQEPNCFNQMPKEDKAPQIGARKSRKRRDNDPDAPGRPLPVFMWFCKDERAKVTALNPKATAPEVAKELGRRWEACPQHLKNKYRALALEDKARYEKEMAVYNRRGSKGKGQSSKSTKESSDEDQKDDDFVELESSTNAPIMAQSINDGWATTTVTTEISTCSSTMKTTNPTDTTTTTTTTTTQTSTITTTTITTPTTVPTTTTTTTVTKTETPTTTTIIITIITPTTTTITTTTITADNNKNLHVQTSPLKSNRTSRLFVTPAEVQMPPPSQASIATSSTQANIIDSNYEDCCSQTSPGLLEKNTQADSTDNSNAADQHQQHVAAAASVAQKKEISNSEIECSISSGSYESANSASFDFNENNVCSSTITDNNASNDQAQPSIADHTIPSLPETTASSLSPSDEDERHGYHYGFLDESTYDSTIIDTS